MHEKQIFIVGAGLSGLAAAKELEQNGYSPVLLEKSGQVGGRLRTLKEEGFCFDVGFQVLLDSYPEIAEYKEELKLKAFRKGARYFWENDFSTLNLLNPFRLKPHEIKGIFKSLSFFLKTGDKPVKELLERDPFFRAFWTPFFKGVFLDPDLSTRQSRLRELFPYFVKGSATLPEKGMQEIAEVMKRGLKTTQIHFETPVERVDKSRVVLASQKVLEANKVIVATPCHETCRLTGFPDTMEGVSTEVFYFSIDKAGMNPDRFLWLDGRKETVVNNFCVLSAVQPAYAPPNKHLISVSTIGSESIPEGTVQSYLAHALKVESNKLTFLKRLSVSHALPLQDKKPPSKERVFNGIFLAGEIVDPPSINDAILSGKKAARAAIKGGE